MSKGGKFSLLLGMATGALTSLLFAPSRGKDLRKRIAKERESGGFGHKAVVGDLTQMAEELGHIAKDVAESDEAQKFWLKTNETVNELTSGAVDLDEWVKEAHSKADQFKKVVSRYAAERKHYLEKAKGIAKSVKKKSQRARAARRKSAASKSSKKK